MARKSNAARQGRSTKRALVSGSSSTPKFPYTNKPGSLRRLLREIPKRPKPAKFDKDLLRSWGFTDSNDYSTLRVLKAIGLLNDKNEPNDLYATFMNLTIGARALAPKIKMVYAPLFQASHKPYDEGTDTLQNLFNIHSGGGQSTLDLQIQTFKALCENVSFDTTSSMDGDEASPKENLARSGAISSTLAGNAGPVININLHIHLPENKSRREYEDIIEDIGKYIFGRTVSGRV